MQGPTGTLEFLTVGSGLPSTVFGHGLGGSISTTRPFGSGVPGSRTFLHFRGHGASQAPHDTWSYAALAAELRAVADRVAATRALGISMGSGALLRLLESDPDRFERCVFMLPAGLDAPRGDRGLHRLVHTADYVERRDVEGLMHALLAEQPAAVRERPEVVAWARSHARTLIGTPVAAAYRQVPNLVPMTDRALARRVTAPALVVAQEGDPVHPVHIAEELADLLPNARLLVLPTGGLMWDHRATVRAAVSEFLSEGV